MVMAKCGRLSREEKLKKVQYTKEAEEWLKHIGECYEEYQKKYKKMFKDLNYELSDDVLNDTIIACYNSIARNDIADKTPQGYKNYLFRALKTNINIVPTYDKRKDSTDDINDVYERYTVGDESYKITKQQLLNDFSTIYIMGKIEHNFDGVDFHLFRLKHLLPKCTYENLREITGVKDCKKRVVNVMKWVRENISKKEINEAFYNNYPEFVD